MTAQDAARQAFSEAAQAHSGLVPMIQRLNERLKQDGAFEVVAVPVDGGRFSGPLVSTCGQFIELDLEGERRFINLAHVCSLRIVNHP